MSVVSKVDTIFVFVLEYSGDAAPSVVHSSVCLCFLVTVLLSFQSLFHSIAYPTPAVLGSSQRTVCLGTMFLPLAWGPLGFLDLEVVLDSSR